MVYFCLTLLEYRFIGQKPNKRENVCQHYHIEKEVFDAIGDLTANIGDLSFTRKRGPCVDSLTKQEGKFLKKAVHEIVYSATQVAADDSQRLPQITKAYLLNRWSVSASFVDLLGGTVYDRALKNFAVNEICGMIWCAKKPVACVRRISVIHEGELIDTSIVPSPELQSDLAILSSGAPCRAAPPRLAQQPSPPRPCIPSPRTAPCNCTIHAIYNERGDARSQLCRGGAPWNQEEEYSIQAEKRSGSIKKGSG